MRIKRRYQKTTLRIGIFMIIFLSLVIGLAIYYCPNIKALNSKEIDVFKEYDSNDFKAYQGGKDVKELVKVESNVDTNKIGTYKTIYKKSYGIFNIQKIQVVKVVDRENPVITLNGNKEVNVCSADKYIEEGYKALDNYDGDITSKVEITKNDKFIYYQVRDSSKNEFGIGRILRIKDDEAPTINLNGNREISIQVGGSYEELGAVANDNCDGDISSDITIEGNVDTNKVGTYQIKYTIKDKSENTASVLRTINVFDPNANSGTIYLTFDDGPGAYTTQILDILDKYNIKATFFVTNNGSDEVLKEEYDRGHTIGLHTATHQWSIYNSVSSYFDDLNSVQARVERVTGQRSFYIRFPGGSSNTISRSRSKGIMTTLTGKVQEEGYKYFDWNVCVEDAGACAKRNVSDREACVYNYFTGYLSKNRVNVVLLHDIKSYTANALEQMIKYGLEQGYTFKAINDDTPMIHQRVNN